MKRVATALLFASLLSGGSLTPAGKAIESAQTAIASDPGKPELHSALALAYARRARETADSDYYNKAASAVAKSLELSPGNLEALKLQAWVFLGKHEFAKALELAIELRTRTGDDEMVYGLLTDANVELGKYKEAEDSAQWMLNVGRSSVPGLTRAAYLREIFGDIEGAIDLMNQVFNRLPPNETEDRAWTLSQIAHLLTLTGKNEDADRVLADALRLMPDYHYALAALAKVRVSEGKYDEASTLLRRRCELAPHPENFFDLGAALWAAGRRAEAKVTFAQFESKALAESQRWDNANRELVRYYADYAARPDAALRVASNELGRRSDILTLDAHAWALHKNRRDREALAEIESALAVGTVDSRILYHAGVIASAAGNNELAKKYLLRSVAVNSRSEVASEAKHLIERLEARPPQTAMRRH